MNSSIEPDDEKKIKRLFGIYSPYVHRIAMDNLRSKELADEIVRAVYYALVHHYKELRNMEELESFIAYTTEALVKTHLTLLSRRQDVKKTIPEKQSIWRRFLDLLKRRRKRTMPEFIRLIGSGYREWRKPGELVILDWSARTRQHSTILQVMIQIKNEPGSTDPDRAPVTVICNGLLHARPDGKGYWSASILCTHSDVLTFAWVIFMLWSEGIRIRDQWVVTGRQFENDVIIGFSGRVRKKLSRQNPRLRHPFADWNIADLFFLN